MCSVLYLLYRFSLVEHYLYIQYNMYFFCFLISTPSESDYFLFSRKLLNYYIITIGEEDCFSFAGKKSTIEIQIQIKIEYTSSIYQIEAR